MSRINVAFLAFLVLLSLLVAPAVALAAPVLVAITPADGGTASGTWNPAITVQVSSGSTLSPTLSLSIDSRNFTLPVNYAVSGFMDYSSGSPVWVTTRDYTHGTAYVTCPPLAPGPHAIFMVVTDASGGTLSRTTTFNLVPPAVLSAPSPAPASIVATDMPDVSVALDPRYVAQVALTIDGKGVSSSLDPASGRVRAARTPLANGAVHTASATWFDGAGRTSALSWSFTTSYTCMTQITGVAPAQDAVVSDPAGISFAVTDPVGISGAAQVTVDGAAASIATSSLSAGKSMLVSVAPRAWSEGVHTVTASASDSRGGSTSRTWTFRGASALRLTAISPANGSFCPSATPLLSVAVSSTAGSVAGTFTVAGQVVRGVFDAARGALTATLSVPLADETPCTLVAEVTDASGGRVSISSRFTPRLYTTGPSAACVGCHSTFPASHPVANCNACHHHGAYYGQPCGACHASRPSHGTAMLYRALCTDCHGVGDPYVPEHPVDLDARHDSTTPFTACGHCHTRAIAVEHPRHTDAGGHAYDCATCHATTARQQVKDAIAAMDSRCEACHTPHASHATTSTTCAGPGCHNDANLVPVHAAVGCAACHSSADPKVAAAIAARNHDCKACHNPMAVHGAVHNASTTYEGPVAMPQPGVRGGDATAGYVLRCTSCHRVNILADHGTTYDNCPMCHATGGPRSSFTTWDKTCRTGACHPFVNGTTVAPHGVATRAMDHTLLGVGQMPTGYCQSCHGNPEGWQCGAPFGCHATTTPPFTAVDYKAPSTVATRTGADPIVWRLNATDVGDGVVATYFSFDGAPFALYTPAMASTGITNPADVAAPFAHTLRYYSIDAANNTETVQTTDYNVTDITAPNVTFNGVSLGSGIFAAKSLVMSVVDPKVRGLNTGVAFVHTEVKTYKTNWGWFPYQAFYQSMNDFNYPLDGTWDTTRDIAPVETYAKAKSSPGFWPTYGGVINDGGGGDAWFEIQYYARDYTGNTSPMTYAKLYVDNTPPVTTTQTLAPYTFRINMNDNISGVAATYYRFDGAPYVLCTPAQASAGVTNTAPGGNSSGSHTMDFYSVDNVGNVEAVKSYTYIIP